MSILDQIVAKARGEKPERQRFTLPLPTTRCDCGSDCVIREPGQDDWDCLACDLRAGRKFPLMSEQARDGWQGGIVGCE